METREFTEAVRTGVKERQLFDMNCIPWGHTGIPFIFHLSWLTVIGRKIFSGKLESNLSAEIYILVSVTHNYVLLPVARKTRQIGLKEYMYLNG